MNKIIDWFFGWIKESNRMAHLKAGAIITAIMFVLCAVYNVYVLFMLDRDLRPDFVVLSLLFTSVVAFVCTGIAMMTVEYIQKKMGGEWDNKDISAGILIPLCLVVLTSIIGIAVL